MSATPPRTGWLPAALLAGAALLTVSCASNREPRRAWSPRVSPELLTHFRIDEPARGPSLATSSASDLTTRLDGARTGSAPSAFVLGSPSTTPHDADPAADAPPPLSLEDVLRSVESHFPLILAAFAEIEIAAGKLENAAGAFDTKVSATGKFETEGFYENDRIGFEIEQPTTLWGARFEGGYRRGDGDFAVYDGKAKTNRDGELRLGLMVPLLQGRSVDPARTKLLQGQLEQDKADPRILEKRLSATRKAAETYWKWLATGQKRSIAAEQLALAETRREQLRIAVEEGELAEINLVDNERLIVDRTAKLQRAEQDLAQAAIVLSLYWRDADGHPLVPDLDQLPSRLPDPRPLDEILIEGDEQLALAQRPELRQVQLELDGLRLERDLASNQMLPSVDVGLFGSQDYGNAVNTPDDKDELELQAVLRFSVPLQRRKASGSRRTATAKIAKLEQQARFLSDVVVSEVRQSVAVLEQTLARLDQARRNVELARELERAERLQLELGESDLFRVNLREQQSAVAARNLVEVLAEHYFALAGYRAVLGLPYDEVVAGERLGGAR